MYAQPTAILVRMLAVMLLVSGTYNPSGYSYYHWVTETGTELWVAKLFTLMVLVGGYAVTINATWRSLGLLLGLPFVLVIATLIWLAADQGWLDMSDWLQRTLALQAALVVLLGTGVSFSIIRYRLSGQMDSRTLS
ncbi:MAG: DUF6524 family protein [Acetobacteraceae bacterium]